MKKKLTKIIAVSDAVVAAVFVVVLLIAVFGGIKDADFDNNLVKGLFVALSITFAILTITTLSLLFTNDDIIKEIVLSQNGDGGTAVSVKDVKKKTKKVVASVKGLKCTRCTVLENEYGVRMKLTVKVKDKDVTFIDDELRNMLENEYARVYNGFRFISIDIKISKLKIAPPEEYNPEAPNIADMTSADAIADEVRINEPEPANEEPDEAEPAECAAAEEAPEPPLHKPETDEEDQSVEEILSELD